MVGARPSPTAYHPPPTTHRLARRLANPIGACENAMPALLASSRGTRPKRSTRQAATPMNATWR
eukprot:scaffold91215_cov45-Phaeocystis_antarctica.AAC.3